MKTQRQSLLDRASLFGQGRVRSFLLPSNPLQSLDSTINGNRELEQWDSEMDSLDTGSDRRTEDKIEDRPQQQLPSSISHFYLLTSVRKFTEGMLRGWRHERKCKGAGGKMWICPHKQFDFQSTQNFIDGVGTSCDDNVHFSYVNLEGVTISLPVMVCL